MKLNQLTFFICATFLNLNVNAWFKLSKFAAELQENPMQKILRVVKFILFKKEVRFEYVEIKGLNKHCSANLYQNL
jgi:hypothetical protein